MSHLPDPLERSVLSAPVPPLAMDARAAVVRGGGRALRAAEPRTFLPGAWEELVQNGPSARGRGTKDEIIFFR